MNADKQHSNKNTSRSVANSRSIGSPHRNLQELIENSSRVKQLNAYQKMADAYSSRQQNLVQKKQKDDEVNDCFAERKKMPTLAFADNTKTNEDSSEKIQNSNNTVIQKANFKPKAKTKPKHPGTKKNPLKHVKKKHKAKVKKQTMTVRNKKDNYTSGVITELSRSTGVNAGPRNEAQKVASFLGGTWVGGHMVNDQLGGTGDFSNIVPITASMNGKHKFIENRANNYLSRRNGTSIEYKMTINEREDRTNGEMTVKNLPVEFQQTLEVDPPDDDAFTVNGNVLRHP